MSVNSVSTGSEVMACSLIGAKPLSEPVLTYHRLYPMGTGYFREFESKHKLKSFQENAFENVVYKIATILFRPLWL